MRTLLLFLSCIFSLNVLLGQSNNVKLKITHLSGDFYIYTTYNTYKESLLPANGMYLLTHKGVVLFDTPWDTTQFQALLDSIQFKHHQNVVLCIATHWHNDRTAGLDYYSRHGIKTYTTALTDAWCQKNNMKRAQNLIVQDTIFNMEPYSFETFYPGEGHTADNIIIWFSKEKILYGGCLIKGADAKNLGYLGDANVSTYASTLKNVQHKCPNPSTIIISHSDWNNIHSLTHSIHLAKKLKRKNKS